MIRAVAAGEGEGLVGTAPRKVVCVLGPVRYGDLHLDFICAASVLDHHITLGRVGRVDGDILNPIDHCTAGLRQQELPEALPFLAGVGFLGIFFRSVVGRLRCVCIGRGGLTAAASG